MQFPFAIGSHIFRLEELYLLKYDLSALSWVLLSVSFLEDYFLQLVVMSSFLVIPIYLILHTFVLISLVAYSQNEALLVYQLSSLL